jgi:hypothetical protein
MRRWFILQHCTGVTCEEACTFTSCEDTHRGLAIAQKRMTGESPARRAPARMAVPAGVIFILLLAAAAWLLLR